MRKFLFNHHLWSVFLYHLVCHFQLEDILPAFAKIQIWDADHDSECTDALDHSAKISLLLKNYDSQTLSTSFWEKFLKCKKSFFPFLWSFNKIHWISKKYQHLAVLLNNVNQRFGHSPQMLVKLHNREGPWNPFQLCAHFVILAKNKIATKISTSEQRSNL